MKSGSDKFTFTRQTDPQCFRAIATGIGQSLAGSEETGEQRKTRVMARPGSSAAAPGNEGFATRTSYPKRSWRANDTEELELPDCDSDDMKGSSMAGGHGGGY